MRRNMPLREFMALGLGNRVVVGVVDKPKRINPLTIDEFALVTGRVVTDERLFRIIRDYFEVADQDAPASSHFIWIPDDAGRLLVVVLNYSDSLNGAKYFGGPKGKGGIGIEVIRQNTNTQPTEGSKA